MTDNKHRGQWHVQARKGSIRMKTSRIGLFTITASAPIVGGTADWSSADAVLTFQVGINEVTTGNPLLDPEVHALVAKGSDGVLTFTGTGTVNGDDIAFAGIAKAGNVEVSLQLTGLVAGENADRDVSISGTATFSDIQLPLPGLSNVNHIDVYIVGELKLRKPTD